mgnify:CR=1 FL=1
MTDDPPTGIPIDDHPDPVLAYELSDGEPIITAANTPFEILPDTASTPETVTDVFKWFDAINSTGPPLQQLRGSDPANIELERQGSRDRMVARVVPADDDRGWIIFTPTDEPHSTATTDIGHVASVVSHDLRNPLDVAKANLQAARETGDSEYFDAVAGAHDRMERIIQDVLTLARGQRVVTPSEQIDIETVVEDAWRSVAAEQATLETADALPTTTADPDRLRRVFENLFRNAIEHGTAGSDARAEDRVTITVGPLENGFFVADDGAGVPPDEQEAVFSPGYSTKDSGTGLGLAIVEKIVTAHGWDVTLTTGADGGTRFEISF